MRELGYKIGGKVELKNTLTILKTKIENNKGVSIFASNNSKFENWLQVELCGILKNNYEEITPEKSIQGSERAYDIVVDSEIAIELKIFTLQKSASRNVECVIKDITALQEIRGNVQKLLVFVVFPTTTPKDIEKWKTYKNKIFDKIAELNLGELTLCAPLEFTFCDTTVKGLLYLGEIKRG